MPISAKLLKYKFKYKIFELSFSLYCFIVWMKICYVVVLLFLFSSITAYIIWQYMHLLGKSSWIDCFLILRYACTVHSMLLLCWFYLRVVSLTLFVSFSSGKCSWLIDHAVIILWPCVSPRPHMSLHIMSRHVINLRPWIATLPCKPNIPLLTN